MIEKPILLDIPEQLESERLLLHAVQLGDHETVYPAVMDSMDVLSQWMDWATEPLSFEDSLGVNRRSRAQFITREGFSYYLWLKSDDQFAGALGIHNIDWSIPRFEIGYWMRTALTGQGLMTEAVQRVTQFLFDDLGANRVEIRCEGANQRSAAVAERAGFMLEGRLRHERRANSGALADTLIYARIREA